MHQPAMSQPEASLPCPAPAVGSADPAPKSSDALLLNSDLYTGEPSDPSLSVSEGARLYLDNGELSDPSLSVSDGARL